MIDKKTDDYINGLTLSLEYAGTLAEMAESCMDDLVDYPVCDGYLKGQLAGFSSILRMIARLSAGHEDFHAWLMDEKPDASATEEKEEA